MRKSLGAGEQIVLARRRHAKILVWPALALIGVALGAGAGAALIPGDYRPLGQLAIAALGLLLAGWWSLAPFLRWLATTYTVTTRRLITRSGVLTRIGTTLPLTRINDVSSERSLGDRLLGCGTLIIQTAAEGAIVLHDVPDVEHAQQVLTELIFGPADRDGQTLPRWAER